MTTLAKLETNRTNGKLSTGPKTDNGKKAAKMNAVTHGLRSLSPVLPDERPKDWNDHRKGIVAALAPVGTLEAELVERVALLTWRLRRVVRYETAATIAEIESASARIQGKTDRSDPSHAASAARSQQESSPRTCASVRKELEEARKCAEAFADLRDQLRRLPDLPADHPLDGGDAYSLLREAGAYSPTGDGGSFDIEDHKFLEVIGVPEERREDADWWDGWTAGVVRAGVRVIATVHGLTEATLIEWAVENADRTACTEERKVMKLEPLLTSLTEEVTDPERVASGRVLPSAEVIDKVMRYESHLNKQLTQTLHQLERLQAIRSGNPPAPPAALDVTVEAGH